MGELTKSVVLTHTPNFFNGKLVWYGMVWCGMVGACREELLWSIQQKMVRHDFTVTFLDSISQLGTIFSFFVCECESRSTTTPPHEFSRFLLVIIVIDRKSEPRIWLVIVNSSSQKLVPGIRRQKKCPLQQTRIAPYMFLPQLY